MTIIRQRIMATVVVDMNVAEYSLWYVGEGYHELIRDTKNGIAERHANNLLGGGDESRRQAEYLLDMVSFDRENRARIDIRAGKANANLARLHSREIGRVHSAKGDEIRGRWSYPLMDDQEFMESVSRDFIDAKLLGKDHQEQEIELSLG